jgi:hypothetical protein
MFDVTDLKDKEVIVDKKGRHFHFVGLEETELEAMKLVEEVQDAGFIAAIFQREDNKFFEVFSKFTDAEECIYFWDRHYCDVCPPETKSKCSAKTCKIQMKKEDILWKEERGFVTLIRHELKKLHEPGIGG